MPSYLPDPLFSANIYCEGHIDEILLGAVGSFWRDVRLRDPEGEGYLWVMRYARRGEHVKLRLHGPGSWEAFRPLLAAAVVACFDSLGDPKAENGRMERIDIPPIDTEDFDEGLVADRTLLWTRYQRSHVSLPSGPYLRDDRFLMLFTACQGTACEQILAALKPGADGRVPTKLRQTTLLKSLISGLGALGWQAPDCIAYLTYHRDWLIRFTLQRNGADLDKYRELLAHFDDQVGKMSSTLRQLCSLALSDWEGGDKPLTNPWRRSLADLASYLNLVVTEPDRNIDSFAPYPIFTPIFKVFHGLANALGLNAIDEGFTHHILLRAVKTQDFEVDSPTPAPSVRIGLR